MKANPYLRNEEHKQELGCCSRLGQTADERLSSQSEVSKTDESATVNDRFDLSKTPQNLMMAVVLEYKGLRVTAYPGRAFLKGSNTIHGPLEQIR
jgi:hypothetical protein